MTTQQEELRRIINLIESAQQPAQAEDGARIAASVAPYIKDLANMDFDLSDLKGLKEEELDEVNWKKGLAGVAAAGALALGGAGAAHAGGMPAGYQAGYMSGQPQICLSVYKLASSVAAKNGNMRAAQVFNSAAYKVGRLLNPAFDRSDIDSMISMDLAMGMVKAAGGLGPAVGMCTDSMKGRRPAY